MALSTVQMSVESRLSEAAHKRLDRWLSRAVFPSLPISATTFPTVLSLHIAQGRLRKNIRYPSCCQRQNCCHLKRKSTSTWFVFLHVTCQCNAAGWSTAGWPANGKFQLLHRHSSISRSPCSSAKLLVFTCLLESVFYSPLCGNLSDSLTPYKTFSNKLPWPMCWSLGIWVEWGSGFRTFQVTSPLENLVCAVC